MFYQKPPPPPSLLHFYYHLSPQYPHPHYHHYHYHRYHRYRRMSLHNDHHHHHRPFECSFHLPPLPYHQQVPTPVLLPTNPFSFLLSLHSEDSRRLLAVPS